ncbi:hypothetical protein [Streptomyces sp. NBC_00344]
MDVTHWALLPRSDADESLPCQAVRRDCKGVVPVVAVLTSRAVPA